MCPACDWGKYFASDGSKPSALSGLHLSRQSVLQATAVLVPVLLAGAGARGALAAEAGADFVFHNGQVHTVDAKKRWARSVAVKGHKIVYVDDDAAVKIFVGANTKTVDLVGRMLLPGFVEGHTHHRPQFSIAAALAAFLEVARFV